MSHAIRPTLLSVALVLLTVVGASAQAHEQYRSGNCNLLDFGFAMALTALDGTELAGIGEVKSGELSSDDKRSANGAYWDYWVLFVCQTTDVAIEMTSNTMDSQLLLNQWVTREFDAWEPVASDDDSGYELDARIEQRLGPGVYGIVATTIEIETGAYQLSIREASLGPTPASSARPVRDNGPATGSGFYVSAAGHVLTNAHVVEQCRDIRIPPDGSADVLARDDASDLALLRNDVPNPPSAAAFRGGRGLQPGADVVVMGFPLQGLVSSGPNVSTGVISSLAGPSDDRRYFQMTAPIQPGSSGGPVLDRSGNVVGVATATLDPLLTARETGDIPQNVNFAVSAGIVRTFLDAEGAEYEVLPSDATLGTESIATAARRFTVRVECWK